MKRINLSINLHFSLLSFPYFALSFPQDSKCVLPVAPPRRRVSELLLRQLESNLLPALNCCRCLGDGLGGEQRLMQPRFQGAVHSMCISGSFAGQEEREGAGGVLGVVVLPASPGRGAGAKGTDKLLGAPMAGVCCCGQPQLVPACLASNTTRSAWWNLPVKCRSLPEQGNAKTGLVWTWSLPTLWSVSGTASTNAWETTSEQGVLEGSLPSFPLLSLQSPALLAQVFMERPLPTS